MAATAEEDILDEIAYAKRNQLTDDVENIVATEEAEKVYPGPPIIEVIVAAAEEDNSVKGPVDNLETVAAPEEDESRHETVANEEPLAVVPGDSDLIPDYLTPTIILVGVNIIVPTLDLYRDLTMITRLFNTGYSEYYGWTSFLLLGLFINFFFISLAWCRYIHTQVSLLTWV